MREVKSKSTSTSRPRKSEVEDQGKQEVVYHRSSDFLTPYLTRKQSKEQGGPNLTVIFDLCPNPTTEVQHRLNSTTDVPLGKLWITKEGLT